MSDSKYWKPHTGGAKNVESTKKKEKRDQNSRNETSPTMKPASSATTNPTLSKAVMGMKFMRRNEEVAPAVVPNPEPSADAVQSSRAPSSSSGVIQFERDRSTVTFPGRRSFGGCNKFIERHYAKVLEDQYNIKVAEKEKKQTISDEEMLKRYENLVSLPRGPSQGVRQKFEKKKRDRDEVVDMVQIPNGVDQQLKKKKKENDARKKK